VLHKVAFILGFIFYAGLAQADPLRLLAFGDSLVQGYGLSQEEGFVPQLEARLQNEGYDIEVINAGVSGDTTAGGAARIDWALAEPFDAILILLGGNDALRGLPPAQAKANLGKIIAISQEKGLKVFLVGVQGPGNYGQAYQTEFDQIYSDLAHQFGVVVYSDIFAGISERVSGGDRLSLFMQADGIHPNGLGVGVNIEGLLPRLKALIENFL